MFKVDEEGYKEILEDTELVKEVFIVSEVELVVEAGETFTQSEELAVAIKVEHAPGEKCETGEGGGTRGFGTKWAAEAKAEKKSLGNRKGREEGRERE